MVAAVFILHCPRVSPATGTPESHMSVSQKYQLVDLITMIRALLARGNENLV